MSEINIFSGIWQTTKAAWLLAGYRQVGDMDMHDGSLIIVCEWGWIFYHVLVSLSCSHETSSELLSPVQKRLVGACPEEDHENNQTSRTTLLLRKAERVGVVHPGEEKALGKHYWGHLTLNESLSDRLGENFLPRRVVTGKGARVLNWK